MYCTVPHKTLARRAEPARQRTRPSGAADAKAWFQAPPWSAEWPRPVENPGSGGKGCRENRQAQPSPTCTNPSFQCRPCTQRQSHPKNQSGARWGSLTLDEEDLVGEKDPVVGSRPPYTTGKIIFWGRQEGKESGPQSQGSTNGDRQ